MGEILQSMVVLVGELVAISAAYLADRTTRQVQSALKTVDICFKAYLVLHPQYPVADAVKHWYILSVLSSLT